jgi:Mg2+/Co2+ transporter CorB
MNYDYYYPQAPITYHNGYSHNIPQQYHHQQQQQQQQSIDYSHCDCSNNNVTTLQYSLNYTLPTTAATTTATLAKHFIEQSDDNKKIIKTIKTPKSK